MHASFLERSWLSWLRGLQTIPSMSFLELDAWKKGSVPIAAGSTAAITRWYASIGNRLAPACGGAGEEDSSTLSQPSLPLRPFLPFLFLFFFLFPLGKGLPPALVRLCRSSSHALASRPFEATIESAQAIVPQWTAHVRDQRAHHAAPLPPSMSTAPLPTKPTTTPSTPTNTGEVLWLLVVVVAVVAPARKLRPPCRSSDDRTTSARMTPATRPTNDRTTHVPVSVYTNNACTNPDGTSIDARPVGGEGDREGGASGPAAVSAKCLFATAL